MTTHDKRIATKAAAIIAERRIKPCPEARAFTVLGDTGAYVVTVWGHEESDVSCTCEAGRRGTMCSHALAGLRMYAAPGHFV